MNTRQSLIKTALQERYIAVCKRLETVSNDVGDSNEFIAKTRSVVLERSRSSAYAQWTLPASWFDSDYDCLSSLRKLAKDQLLAATELEVPAAFDQTLRAAARNSEQRFQLLTERYTHPLNFSAPSEAPVREHVLERLMVQDRARIEGHGFDGVDLDDLLLRLNLVAIHASTIADLRFIDALNYYFELLPSDLRTKSARSWLVVSFLALYARVLVVRQEGAV